MSNMKTTIIDVISKYGDLVPDANTKEMLATDILNHFLENKLIDDKSYEKNFSKDTAKKEIDTSKGAPPRGVGPIPVEERPSKEVTAEVVEEEVVEVSPKKTPKKEKKNSPKSKKGKKGKFGWLGE